MARYVYEVELRPDEDGGFCVRVPDLDGCFTEGDDLIDALNMADDALKTHVASLIRHGDDVPAPVFGHEAPKGGRVVALSFETDATYILDTVSPAEAAQMLGVSRGRVSQMMRDGILEAYKIGTETKVSLASVNARLVSPARSGRPRKEIAAV